MKILFTSQNFYPDIGGIEVNSEILIKYLHAKGHKVKLITQTINNKEDKYPFIIYRKPSIIKSIKLFIWADIVFQNNIELKSLWPNIIARRPFVISLCTWLRGTDGKRRIIDCIKIIILYYAENVVAISKAIQKDSFKKSVVIGNPYRSKLFKKHNCDKRKKGIAFLGRFVSDKGVELLIEAFARLKLDNERLTLIGSGPSEQEYKILARSLGVNLNLTGSLIGNALVNELNKHKILVIPSLWDEPFGNVALEGMACGCIILAANGGGLPDAVGRAGILFRKGSIDDLTKKLKIIYYDSQIETKLEAKVKQHLENHNEELICSKYLDILINSHNHNKRKNQEQKVSNQIPTKS